MMRLSFLLLLMAAAACSKDCASLLEMTRRDLDDLLSTDFECRRSPANVTKDSVDCSSATPIIAYINNDRDVSFARSMACVEGKWRADNDPRWDVLKTKVCCVGCTGRKTTPLPEKRSECDPLGKLATAAYDTWETRFSLILGTEWSGMELTKTNITNGEVTCIDPTRYLLYKSNPRVIRRAYQIKCSNGYWRAEASFDTQYFVTTDVACSGRTRKMPPADELKR